MINRKHACHLVLAVCLLLAACAKRQPSPPKPYLAFVANQGSNTVAVVNLAESRTVASIPVASEPVKLVARPGADEVWTVSKSGELSVIRFPDFRVVETLHVGKTAGDIFFSPDGSRFFGVDTDSGTVVFGDAQDGRRPAVDGSIPRAVYRYGGGCLTADGKTLILSDAARDSLVFIDTPSRQVVGSVEVGKQPGSVVALPDGSKAFVADTGENAVSAVNVAKRELLSNLEIGSRPVSLELKPDGGELFVLAEGGEMTVIDAFHDDVEQPFPIGRSPAAGVFRKDSSVLYVASAADGSVTAIDVQNRVVLNSTHVGSDPQALALTPDERFLLVAVPASSIIAVLKADPSALTTNDSALVTTIPTGSKPVDVIVPAGIEPLSHRVIE